MDQTQQQQQQQAQQPSQQQDPQPQQQVSAAANTASATTATTTDAAMQQQQPPRQQSRLQQQQKFVPTDSSSDSDRAAKKSAQLGQWRTPPQPFFPSNPSTTSAATVAPASAAAMVIQQSSTRPGVPGGPQPMSTVPPPASASAAGGVAAAGQVTAAAVGGGAATAAVAAATAGATSSSSGDAAATAGGGADLGDFDLASLQEAYRRGMEAARALSQHQLATGQNVFVEPTVGTATSSTTTSGATAPAAGAPPAPAPAAAVIVGGSASCPNLQELNAAQRQQLQQQTAAYKPSGSVMEEPDPQQQPHPHHQAQAQQQPFGSGYQPHAHPGAAFAAPPPAQTSAPATAAVQQQQQQPYAPTGTTPATTSPHAPTPANTPMVSVQHPVDGGMAMPQQPQQHHHPHIPPMQQHHHPGQQPMSVAARSVSLPDMQSYAVKANQEEDKRRKRLARNRASARLRRLRKKNLVESYEGEVGVLESSLSKLRAHSWGMSDDHEALLEALSMERGQQDLSPEQRRDLIRDILAQQREQVSNLMDAQLESMTLGWLVRRSHQSPPAAGGGGGDQKASGEGPGKMKEDGDAVGGGKPAEAEDEERRKKEEDDLAKELEDVLQLTPQQAMQLQKATEGAEEERKAIRTVDMCLEAMMNNSWLLNQGVEECVEQFASILNTGQMSKFLLWTDHNSEAIDQLDYVNAPPASSPPSQTPSFVFGTDDCSHHDDADDGKGQTQHQPHHMQISTPQ